MIYLVLLVHWIADFVLQTDKQAKGKSTSIYWLSKHLAVYTACLLPFGWKYALLNGSAHWVVDFFSSKASSYFYKKGQVHNFFVVVGFDQFLHVAILIYTMPLIAWSF